MVCSRSMKTGTTILWTSLIVLISAGTAFAYDVADYEEDAGISVAGLYDPGGDVYGGGFESGVWLKGAPIFGEIFGHWYVNKLQDGNYYSVGMTLRVMPRRIVAPFIGGGGSYNGLTSDRDRRWSAHPDYRRPDRSYWKGHAEAGLRLWYNQAQFIEGGYRYHWTATGNDFNYGWASIEFGQLF